MTNTEIKTNKSGAMPQEVREMYDKLTPGNKEKVIAEIARLKGQQSSDR